MEGNLPREGQSAHSLETTEGGTSQDVKRKRLSEEYKGYLHPEEGRQRDKVRIQKEIGD